MRQTSDLERPENFRDDLSEGRDFRLSVENLKVPFQVRADPFV